MSNDDWLVYAEHNTVLSKVVAWDTVFGSGLQFSRDVKIYSPDAEIGYKDRCVVLQVLCVGPGNVSRGTLNQTTIKSGDYVVANLFHRSHEPTLMGNSVSVFPWENIMARLDIDHGLKRIGIAPLQAYLICKPNEDLAQKLMMGKSKILAPFGDAQYAGVVPDTQPGRRPTEPNKVVVEEVVAVGPGAVVDGLWQEPPQSLVGGAVMYDTSVSPVRFVLQGSQLTLVHWRHAILTFRKPGEQNAEEAAGATLH